MFFTGLSKSEINSIAKILDEHNIPFEGGQDQNILDSNKQSMKNNIRHLNSPDIETSIYCLIIEDDILEKVDQAVLTKLEKYGIIPYTQMEIEDLDHVDDKPYKRKIPVGQILAAMVVVMVVVSYIFTLLE